MIRITFLIIVLGLSLVSTIAQSQLNPTIVKRIADHTPRSLPQTTKPLKPKSDAEDENIRGIVKTVVEEREYFADDGTSEGRHFSSIVDFNKRGDRVKAAYFGDNGNPYEVSTFGYIDGTRVVSFTTIYEDSGVFGGGAPPAEESQPKSNPDPRYDYKYIYQYIAGKLTGMQIFLSDGSKWMSYTYNYSGNQVEELAYSSNGKLNQKYITVFDSKGNEIAWSDIAVINLPRPDRKYEIETNTVDDQGNWTKRTFFRVETMNGKVTRQATWKIEYRNLTYFESKGGSPKKRLAR